MWHTAQRQVSEVDQSLLGAADGKVSAKQEPPQD